MESRHPHETSPTLLGRLRHDPGDGDAWGTFVQRYGPCIHRWCCYWGLSEADAQDVAQNVLLKLVAKLPQLQYDPARSFRGWLKTLTHHAWRDFVDGQRRPDAASGDSGMFQSLQELEARDDLVRSLGEEFDLELLELATARVRLRVAPHTWEAFRLLTVEGLPAAEVAPRVGMQLTMVYVAKSKVTKMLTEEIRKLADDEP
jgi:RNA polymerase sigma factor (sigma-70 family)